MPKADSPTVSPKTRCECGADSLRLELAGLEQLLDVHENTVFEQSRKLRLETDDHKRTAEALQVSEARFRELFERVHLGVAICRAVDDGDDFEFVDLNRAAEELEGVSRLALIGRSVNERAPGAIDSDLLPVLQRVWRTGVAEEHPITEYCDDRIVRWRDNTVFRLPSGEVVAVCDDVTERVAAEQERERLYEHLRQAQKLEAIGTLAGGIAHDFNNILAAIIGFAELAGDDAPVDGSTRADLDCVLEAAERGREMVRQILTFSRQSERTRRLVSVGTEVTSALDLLRGSIPSTLRIDRFIDEDCGHVLTESTGIHQIVMNLCTNAHHATAEIEGKLTVCLDRLDVIGDALARVLGLQQPGPHARLSVADNGCGMDDVTRRRAFEPFFTTKHTGQGTGMGLSVVHGIAAASGGAIRIQTERGVGTRVDVYLPIVDADAIGTCAAPAAIVGGHEHILVVDDAAVLVDMTARILERLGYRVTRQTSAPAALDAIRAQPDRFDLLVTDCTMPNLSGLELSRRATAIRPELPVILITGRSEHIDDRDLRSAGVCQIASKPVRAAELAVLIRQAIDEGTGRIARACSNAG